MSDEPVNDDFSVTLRPTRKGFLLHEGDDRMLRLWVGETSTGQELGLLSYGMFCETQLWGFDYTPVDLSALPIFPVDINERLAAVNAMVAAAKKDLEASPEPHSKTPPHPASS